MSGKFIVLEGPDGCGTTTHAQILSQKLTDVGVKVFQTHEPTAGPIGTSIRGYLSTGSLPHDALQILFTADRAWHVAEQILPALERSETVVCDRYVLSTIMYGSALGLHTEWLAQMNDAFRKPDVQLVFLPPYEVCAERLAGRGKADVMETDSIQRRVYDQYTNHAKDHGITTIDSSRSVDEVADQIFSLVQAA